MIVSKKYLYVETKCVGVERFTSTSLNRLHTILRYLLLISRVKTPIRNPLVMPYLAIPF